MKGPLLQFFLGFALALAVGFCVILRQGDQLKQVTVERDRLREEAAAATQLTSIAFDTVATLTKCIHRLGDAIVTEQEAFAAFPELLPPTSRPSSRRSEAVDLDPRVRWTLIASPESRR